MSCCSPTGSGWKWTSNHSSSCNGTHLYVAPSVTFLAKLCLTCDLLEKIENEGMMSVLDMKQVCPVYSPSIHPVLLQTWTFSVNMQLVSSYNTNIQLAFSAIYHICITLHPPVLAFRPPSLTWQCPRLK